MVSLFPSIAWKTVMFTVWFLAIWVFCAGLWVLIVPSLAGSSVGVVFTLNWPVQPAPANCC